MTTEEIKKLKDQKWDEYCTLRDEYNSSLASKYKEKYEGQFIKWSDITDGESKYMYVINIWPSTDNDGTFKIPVLYFEGVYFTGYISEYIDSTWFKWDQYQQIKFQMHDFNEDTLEYKAGFAGKESLMKIITKEEFQKAFVDLLEQVKEEQLNFDYSIEK